jgi:hypothetical protein
MQSSPLKPWSTFGNLGSLYDTLRSLCLKVGDSFAQSLMSSSIRSKQKPSGKMSTPTNGITRRTNSLSYWSRGFESKNASAKDRSETRKSAKGLKGGS